MLTIIKIHNIQFASQHKPTSLNLDKSTKYLTASESFFLLNHETNNPDSLNKGVPFAANFLACDMTLPAGENYSTGRYYSAITNETYSWHYNSNGVHHIQRINGDGICEVVYTGSCLSVSANPRNSIEQWRAILDVDYLCNKVPGGKLKRLIWVDGTETPMGSLDVEASIATNSFTTPFFDLCPNDCSNLQLCVPETDGCLTGEFIPYVNTDAGLSNFMTDKGFKFAYRYVYYDGRVSELSDRSTLYYQDTKGCFDNSQGFARCMKFRIPIGNPQVEIIEFYFSEDGGVTWFLAERIEKYKQYNSNQQYWYQRDLSENVSSTFSETDCSFDYIFCNDKQKIPIDPKLIIREINPIPRGAQGIMRLKESIAAYNYIKGSCPIDKNEVDKFDIQFNCEDTADSCTTDFVKVTVRAIIYNASRHKNVAIFRMGGGGFGVPDDVTDSAWWSDTHSPLLAAPYIYQGYDQTFTGETRDFIAYIEGTNYWGVMEQWRATPGFSLSGRKKVGVLSGMSESSAIKSMRNDISNGNFYYQEYTFTVPRGTKGFIRLVSHHQTSGAGENQNTSTQVYTVIDNIQTYNGNSSLNLIENRNEIYFDTCNGTDLDLLQAFIVEDFFTTDTAGTPLQQSSAYAGYITDLNNNPVEGALIYYGAQYEVTTDHNGFYSFYIYDGNDSPKGIDIWVEQSCSAFAKIEFFVVVSDKGEIAYGDYQITSTSYRDNFFADIDVPLTDCDNNPVRGVRVAMSGSKYKITDENGIAHFKLRNYDTRNRVARALVMDKGNCFTVDCSNGCNPCLPMGTVSLASCFVTNPTYTLTPTPRLNTESTIANKTGLKHGGRYPFGWVLEGDCGRLSDVNETRYIDIPRVQETGNVSFCTFSFTGGNIQLPTWGKRIKIVRGANLNPYNLQWVVDDFERTSDGKIILTIQSLNDYNAQYFFKTNTVYKYLAGDRIEFIRNGDGQIFDTATFGVLNYLTLSPFNDEDLSGVTDDANYFNQLIIADDGKLDNLTKGAIIELQTPTVSTSEITYREICATIEVDENGHLETQAGTFTSFDTYLVNRQIGTLPAQYFEHKAPSDFWGTISVSDTVNFLDDTGKPHFVNRYANEKRYERNISISSPTQLNYFGDLEKTLDAAEQGAIIAMALKGDKLGIAICENAPFLFEVNDSLLRLGNDGIVRAASIDSVISSPEVNLRGNYGCNYDDIGGIYFGDGFALWPDRKNYGFIIHNYQAAKKTGESVNGQGQIESQCTSFFIKRMKENADFNKNATNDLDKFRYSIGQNKVTQAVYLTIKTLRNSGINNSSEPYTFPNETIIYNPINDSYLGFAGFTPEGFSQLDLHNDTGCLFITFQNSLPYIHSAVTNKWNEFYGIACDEYVGVVLNQFPDKIKIPVSIELQSNKMWYVKNVTTEMSQSRSEIPPIKVKSSQKDKWNAALLNDINSRGGLYNGANMRGYAINVLFIKDNTLNLAYNSIDNQKRVAYNEMDSILIKASVSEQSGFTNNL